MSTIFRKRQIQRHLKHMKHLVFILAILITWTNLFCQTPKQIVSKDSKIQDKPNVTISGFDYGHHKTTEIIKETTEIKQQ